VISKSPGISALLHVLNMYTRDELEASQGYGHTVFELVKAYISSEELLKAMLYAEKYAGW